MKCKILECENEAEVPYPCCSQVHGTSLRMRKNNILHSFDADSDRSIKARDLYTVVEVAYYMSL